MPRQKVASKSLTLDKRSKIMIGVLAVVLVIAGAYFMLKKGSSSSNTASGLVPKPSAGASAPKAKAVPKVTPKVTPSPVVTADSTRDPFLPLIQEAAATSSSNPSGTSSPAPSPTTAAPTASPTSSAPATGSHTVLLVSITGTNAAITYNKGDLTVKAGTTIAPGVTVVKVDPDSIVVSYGNQIFAIAPGQTVTF
jgi:hypothetical protein